MAGKETPRQKMINMMYLIFIAMLALNMSKEVLSAFGSLTEELSETNKELIERNDKFKGGLDLLAQDQPLKYDDLVRKADSIMILSKDLYDYLDGLKEGAYLSAEKSQIKRTDYEKLDKTVYFEQLLLNGAKLKPAGQEFLDNMKTYREGFYNIAIQDPLLDEIAVEVQNGFSTADVIDSKGKKRTYLDYHYKGMPMIAAITKITLIQSSIKNIEAQLLSTMVGGKLRVEATLTNFEPIIIPDKSSYLPNENFTGRVILGKKDTTLVAQQVIINGAELPESAMNKGVTLLDFPSGAVGTRTIEGKFIFMEDGEPLELDVVNQDGEPFTYEVVAPPNSASVSADKMNVVYYGVKNPFTISIPGISPNRTTVRAPGVRKGKSVMNEYGITETKNGPSDYELDLTDADLGTDATKLTVTVSGQTNDGAQVGPFETVFRVKDLPTPESAFNRAYGEFGQTKMDLIQGQLNARFSPDFDFDLPVIITSFDIQVRGQLISNQGSELSAQAKGAIGAAPSGTLLQVENIKTAAIGSNVQTKPASNFAIIIN